MDVKEGYDGSATIYSPDGRLFQVEYARRAIDMGGISVGMVYDGGVVLILNKRVDNTLIEVDKIEKMFKLSDSMACTSSGLIADARVLVDEVRDMIQNETKLYSESPGVGQMVMAISDMVYSLTLDGGMRLFGVALLIGGLDSNGAHLFITDPSGAYKKVVAGAIGKGSKEVEKELEERYDPDLSFKDAMALCIEMINKATDGNAAPENMEIGVVDANGFRVLGAAELGKAYKKAIK